VEEKTVVIRLDQKFKLRETGTIYIVKIIKDKDVLLMREDGGVLCFFK